MSGSQSASNRRSSLVPPHGPIDRPNAMMVDNSKLIFTPFRHSRQCDEELRPREEKEAKSRTERLSLLNAENFVQQHRPESVQAVKK